MTHEQIDAQQSDADADTEVVNGGDRGCGELLLVLAARSKDLGPGSRIRLFATDPAAPIDLPAWCYLTGHVYLGPGIDIEGRPYYDIRLADVERSTHPTQPWRLTPEAPGHHHREEHP